MTPKPKITDAQLRFAHDVQPLLEAIGAARIRVSEADRALQDAKLAYKTKVSTKVGVPIEMLEFPNDPCDNRFVDFHVRDLSKDGHPCVFCGASKIPLDP